jgi:acyl-coenzyme A synthetase/AMP-(fatty) acid ligase
MIHAFLVMVEGVQFDPEALRQFAASRLDPSRRPVAFHLVESLPRTDSGKLQRLRLRDKLTLAD